MVLIENNAKKAIHSVLFEWFIWYWFCNPITNIHNHFLALTIFLFFNFLASFPERTFPSWFFRFFIFSFTCFYWLRILFFFARNIIRGFSFCFYRLLDPPPFFPLGLCLNLSFFYGFCLFYAFISVLDFL